MNEFLFVSNIYHYLNNKYLIFYLLISLYMKTFKKFYKKVLNDLS